jgi:hypothetical protein
MRGDYCGFTRINGESFDVSVEGVHFGLHRDNKFVRHCKASALRKAGVYVATAGNTVRKVYGRNGFIGSPKR